MIQRKITNKISKCDRTGEVWITFKKELFEKVPEGNKIKYRCFSVQTFRMSIADFKEQLIDIDMRVIDQFKKPKIAKKKKKKKSKK